MITTYDPTPYLWSNEDFQRISETGVFADIRVELIEGQVLNMSPMGSPHVVGLLLLTNELPKMVGEGYSVLVQGPLALNERSQPLPDGLILQGAPRDYHDHLPSKALLVIELAESSLNFDRTVKARLYATAMIPEYWIINLIDHHIEIFRDPQPELGYATKTLAKKDDAVRLAAAPEIVIEASRLIP